MRMLVLTFVTAATVAASLTKGDELSMKDGGIIRGVVLKETASDVIVLLKFTTVTVRKAEIQSIARTDLERASGSTKRLASWQVCLGIAAQQDWVDDLKAIPATVIDKGPLRFVPYKSFRSGDYEINIYGDPDKPACVEIGVRGRLLQGEAGKNNCVAFVKSLLGRAEDRKVVASLNRAKDAKTNDRFTFEITPETDADAYGGWWVSVYDEGLLEKSRASKSELKAITVPASDLKNRNSNESAGYDQASVGMARKLAGGSSGGSVYVRGYTRANGTYVQPYTRSSPRR